ncbi:HlyD family efflux transporter periplasmic adaptor subunit [Clostridium tagluense]|uniref:efflux RND transporter periplasmic adaptor subunit n=1 Tax=Clostridium tagluense TaxID=360422 RepID=UPI001C0C6783|nr:HlyD family efflux transporter periplasmic adaptor subunit [Clostridium tagluense]MBU3127195.1 HlyD family efflux transporter periplasmic adaptor subunit [Clostridium tagluense]MCB2312059.1 HlyD family efflux transporter periplasmic adaptor subunit [Clostridium tagluense]MCB2316646.1 HlyD family efflux transporter periplasmic adaptor subunit [Clostridium tagluense]MCB2321418.1 HlyD family efflux transporter periplasmic adaptor subunit [Clostridium tagluense]MCB2326430.1 HlyD family efflux t
MKLELNEKTNKVPKKSLFKIVGLVVIVIIAVTGVILNNTVMSNKVAGSKTDANKKIATVKKGNIDIVVQGAGPIYFTKSNKLYSRVTATIKKVNFKTGDKVKPGDVIYELDDKDAQTALNVSKQGLQQNKVTVDASNEAVGNLSISAPFTGQVSNIAVNVGDTVQPGGTLLTITDTSKLKVLLTFNAADVGQIAVGQAANVNVASLMQPVNGTVTYISNQPSATISGGQLYTVEIQFNNPGALLGGMIASGEVKTAKGNVASTNTASLNYLKKQAVVSKTGGTVQSIAVKESQKVSSGNLLIQMENNTVIRAQEAANIGTVTSQNQISLTGSQLEYFKIVSPISGVLSTVNFQVGDIVNPSIQVSEVLDTTQMKFDVPVDEIDIAKIVPGQKVNIRVSFLPSTLITPVIGKIESVAVKGVAVSGVTSYPVTIKVLGGANILKGGMSANAEIQVTNKQNVLYLPIEAITKAEGINYVFVSGDKEGGQRKAVELGENNVKYVEIKSGLNEGDKVIY